MPCLGFLLGSLRSDDVSLIATCPDKGKDVMVVGGGNTGFQEGLFLTRFASKVSILEFMAKPIASAILQDKPDDTVGLPPSVRITL